MGQVIAGDFNQPKKISFLIDKEVTFLADIYPNTLLQVKTHRAARASEWIAVSREEYPDITFQVGDHIRYNLSCLPVYSHNIPNRKCYQVNQLSKLGEIEFCPCVRYERLTT